MKPVKNIYPKHLEKTKYMTSRTRRPKVRESFDLQMLFELSYANYLTVPRSVMEAMPKKWGDSMAALLKELDDTFDWRPKEGRYWCQLRNSRGRFVYDPLLNYRHPNFEYIESIRAEAQKGSDEK